MNDAEIHALQMIDLLLGTQTLKIEESAHTFLKNQNTIVF